MKIKFKDDDLEKLFSDPSFRLRAVSNELTKAYRKVVGFLQAAIDERDLYAFKSLRFEKLAGQRTGQHSVRLNDQWRLILLVSTEGEKALTVVEIDDYH